MLYEVITLTVAGIDLGEKPSVISAIVKYHCTHRGQRNAIDAMDIVGGKGICLGPSNFLARLYQGSPIAITVEGANILTRSIRITSYNVCYTKLLRTRKPKRFMGTMRITSVMRQIQRKVRLVTKTIKNHTASVLLSLKQQEAAKNLLALHA